MTAKVATRAEWLEARKALLIKEKKNLKEADALAEERRSLPMVKLDQDYTFQGPSGPLSLADLFNGKKQLIVYHFMFSPEWEAGCHGCAFVGEHIPPFLGHLRSKDTEFVCVSRAPVQKLEAWKKKNGWTFPWYSSEGSSFNYDFHVTLDESVAPIEYNFRTKEEMRKIAEEKGKNIDWIKGDMPGMSVFCLEDGVIYHTYSTYARGLEFMLTTLKILDLTPKGRQVGASGPGEFKYRYEFEEGEA